MESSGSHTSSFAELPEPGAAQTLDDLIVQLRLLKNWAHNPSYETIARRVNAAWRAAGLPAREWTTAKNTVAACFTRGRRRLNDDLILGIVEALNPDRGYLTQWRQALRNVRGEVTAAAIVQAQSALPEGVAGFTGRRLELAQLVESLSRHEAGQRSRISIIEGMAGVGKTQLALRAGRLLVARCDINQVLFVDLRGFHDNPARPPADPSAVLDSFLRLLGVRGHDVPNDMEGRIRLYRQRLREHRTLVVLDNAATEAQVRPLLTEETDSITLVTSRAVIDLPGVGHASLDVFNAVEALEFMRHRIGDARVNAEPSAASSIAATLSHLPLALDVTAGRINARAGWTLTDELESLRRRRQNLRLDSSVEITLGISYDTLTPDAQHLFQLVAIHPGPDVEAYAAAALAGADPDRILRHLNDLVAGNMLRQHAPGRFGFHDLVHVYGLNVADCNLRESDRQLSLARLVEYYMGTAAKAMDLFAPYERDWRPTVVPGHVRTPEFVDAASAVAWLDDERANMVAAAGQAGPAEANILSAILSRYLDAGAHYRDAEILHTLACRTPERAGQARALGSLGGVHLRLGKIDKALDHTQRSLAIFQEIGDERSECRALGNLGLLNERLGRYPEAISLQQRSVTLARRAGDRAVEGRALGNLGIVYVRTGAYTEALRHFQQALLIAREIGDRVVEGNQMANLGNTYARLGLHPEALERHRQALAIARETGNTDSEGRALGNLGDEYRMLERYDEALDHHRKALSLARQVGNRQGEAQALNDLGGTFCAQDQSDQARECHDQALAIASEINDTYEEARAHDGLGLAYHAVNQNRHAHDHWRRALASFDKLGVPEARKTRARLDNLEH